MKTRIITAVVGLIVLAGVLFTFDTLVFNLVIEIGRASCRERV